MFLPAVHKGPDFFHILVNTCWFCFLFQFSDSNHQMSMQSILLIVFFLNCADLLQSIQIKNIAQQYIGYKIDGKRQGAFTLCPGTPHSQHLHVFNNTQLSEPCLSFGVLTWASLSCHAWLNNWPLVINSTFSTSPLPGDGGAESSSLLTPWLVSLKTVIWRLSWSPQTWVISLYFFILSSGVAYLTYGQSSSWIIYLFPWHVSLALVFSVVF